MRSSSVALGVASLAVAAPVSSFAGSRPGIHARRCRDGNADVRARAFPYLRQRGVHAQLPRPGRADVRAADSNLCRPLALASSEFFKGVAAVLSEYWSASVMPFGAIEAIPILTIARPTRRYGALNATTTVNHFNALLNSVHSVMRKFL